jgi:hypothetical protein
MGVSRMAFHFYRRYIFKNSVKNKWEALALAKQADHDGVIHTFFDQEWVKIDDEPSGWKEGFTKQLSGK